MLAGEPDAFGRMLAAASGAYDEKDGKHSKEAASFAFTVMTTLNGLVIGQAARIHLAEIAGAYVTEITEGANLGDENQVLPSSFETVNSQVPGLKPIFRLSPEDTYQFIKTFADSTETQLPFTQGMGDLTRRLAAKHVPAFVAKKDITQLNDVFAALGNVGGLQLAAEETSVKVKDDTAEQAGKAFSWVSGNTLGLIGIFVPGEIAGAALWTALSTGWSSFDTYKPAKETETEKLGNTDRIETLGRKHAIAQLLMDTGMRPHVSPLDYETAHRSVTSIADDQGKLRPFADIIGDGEAGLLALDRWFIENGLGAKQQSIGRSAKMLADTYNGGKVTSQAQGRTFETITQDTGRQSVSPATE
jgi:hypothetical protein